MFRCEERTVAEEKTAEGFGLLWFEFLLYMYIVVNHFSLRCHIQVIFKYIVPLSSKLGNIYLNLVIVGHTHSDRLKTS